MFGIMEPPKKEIPRPRLDPKDRDINMPTSIPGNYAHRARPPNTDYFVKSLLYKQRMDADEIERNKKTAKIMHDDEFAIRFDEHADKKRYQREIKKRVRMGLVTYEEEIDKRREKLKELIAKEEREFFRETVDQAQHGGDIRLKEMQERANFLKEKREKERLAVVDQKRAQQYMIRCTELRERLHEKAIKETMYGQLQQIRENEAKRESERELDKLWYDLMMKDVRTKMEKEEQDAIDQYNRNKSQTEVLEMQVKGKELLEAEAKRIAEEDRIELKNLQEQLKKDEMEALKKKMEKQIMTQQELEEQITNNQRIRDQKMKEEQDLDQAMKQLAQLELEREKARIPDTASRLKKENAVYANYLNQLAEQKKMEEQTEDKIRDEYQKQIQNKLDTVTCKELEAKRKLHESVLASWAEQLSIKKEREEERLKQKKDEEEFVDQVMQISKKLEVETERLQEEAAKKYRNDLRQQIEYKHYQDLQEARELKRYVEKCKQEEEMYLSMVHKMVDEEMQGGGKHPFRRLLERYNCQCPPHLDDAQ